MQRPQRVLEEGLARGRQDQPVDAPVEHIELADRHRLAPLAQQPLEVQELVAVRRARALGREADDEALDIAPQMQQHALPREIDRCDLHAVPRADDDERVVRQAADRLVHRRAAETGDILQILDRQEAAGLELAIDDQILDALVGEFEEIDAVAPVTRGSRRLRRRPRASVRARPRAAMASSSPRLSVRTICARLP